ncbi:MAG: (2Fe-2S) ferredoxin domain-containing protein [Bacteroidales bacterium]|nr:(2Fe-2S) ferredoxin domain-containing protein [Bacteroidales bacterium]MBR0254603.1 (2Fe-2S) ferredoxin domain-containing protein [Bacteroidales bacterium]
MILKVCVGSSCHLKGSYDVIEALKDIIKKCDVEDLVELRASFCLGFCAQGVTVKAEGLDNPAVEKLGNGDMLLHNVNSENVEELFLRDIYPFIKK